MSVSFKAGIAWMCMATSTNAIGIADRPIRKSTAPNRTRWNQGAELDAKREFFIDVMACLPFLWPGHC